MIITRYLSREVGQALATVTIVLLLAFICQQVVRYLNYAAVGKIPTDVLLTLVSFEIPYLLALLLPLGLYFGILLAYGRLYSENEMAILQMCGFGYRQLSNLTAKIALFTSAIVLALMLWVNPWISAKRQALMSSNEATLHLIQTLIPGRFQVSPDGHYVMYVEAMSRDRKRAENVFVAQEKQGQVPSDKPSWMLVFAEQGYQVKDKQSDDQFFVTTNGYRYQGTPGESDYKVIQFKKYAVRILQSSPHVTHQEDESLSVTALWQDYGNPKRAAELQWRISIAVSAFLLALLGVALCNVRPRRSRYLMLLPAGLIYMVYVNLLFVARHWVEQGVVPVSIGMWWVHGIVIMFLLLIYMFRSKV